MVKNHFAFKRQRVYTLHNIGHIGRRLAFLWEKLNQHHSKRSEHFANAFSRRRWTQRREGILLDSRQKGGRIQVVIAALDGKDIGYCIATISAAAIGDIESIYVEDPWRGRGVGSALMEKTMAWFAIEGIKHRMLGVATGNEEVLPFYARFGFVPSATILRHKDSFS